MELQGTFQNRDLLLSNACLNATPTTSATAMHVADDLNDAKDLSFDAAQVGFSAKKMSVCKFSWKEYPKKQLIIAVLSTTAFVQQYLFHA